MCCLSCCTERSRVLSRSVWQKVFDVNCKLHEYFCMKTAFAIQICWSKPLTNYSACLNQHALAVLLLLCACLPPHMHVHGNTSRSIRAPFSQRSNAAAKRGAVIRRRRNCNWSLRSWHRRAKQQYNARNCLIIYDLMLWHCESNCDIMLEIANNVPFDAFASISAPQFVKWLWILSRIFSSGLSLGLLRCLIKSALSILTRLSRTSSE
jgi:hypothetical protein